MPGRLRLGPGSPGCLQVSIPKPKPLQGSAFQRAFLLRRFEPLVEDDSLPGDFRLEKIALLQGLFESFGGHDDDVQGQPDPVPTISAAA